MPTAVIVVTLPADTCCRLTLRQAEYYRFAARAVYFSILLLSGDIHLNLGPLSLRLRDLPSFYTLQPCDLLQVATPSHVHCLFHAASLFLHHVHGLHIPCHDIIAFVRQELLNNADDYISFGYYNINVFHNQVKRYIVHKEYNSAIGDLSPMAVANALSVPIYMLDEMSASICDKAFIETRTNTDVNKYIILYLHAEHFSCVKIRMSHPTLMMSSAPAATSTDAARTSRPISFLFMAPVMGQTSHQTSSTVTLLCSLACLTTLNLLQYADTPDAADAALSLVPCLSKH